jgi:hypothetical protein
MTVETQGKQSETAERRGEQRGSGERQAEGSSDRGDTGGAE